MKAPMNKKNLASWVALSLVFIMMSVVIFWSLEPFSPIITIDDGIKVKNKVLTKDDTLILEYNYCKNRQVKQGVVRRYIEGNAVYWLPPVPSNVNVGCKNLNVPVELPRDLSNGQYTYNAEIEYKINPIKTVTYYFQSEKFDIINK